MLKWKRAWKHDTWLSQHHIFALHPTGVIPHCEWSPCDRVHCLDVRSWDQPSFRHTHEAFWGLSVTCWLKKVFTTGFQMILPWYTDTSTLYWFISLPPSWKEQWPFGLESKEKRLQSRDTLKILLNWKMKLLPFYFLAHSQKESSSVDWEINSDSKGKESHYSIIGAERGYLGLCILCDHVESQYRRC